ncbi:MAG: recombinase RecJ [Erysipelotrichaceae bacterium]|nr:recombinase RecJ [Erysipelotrichaceae bacterium]
MIWNIIETDSSKSISGLHCGKLLSRLIAANGLSDEKTAELLSNDSELTLSQAECVNKACERILLAAKRGEKVFVGGDYDADGICATAIMKKTLDLLKIPNGYYIPDRFKEGYGLSKETVTLAARKGYQLIITVDNGVKAHEALAEAKKLGMDVIVTDHHRIEEEIGADIVVHPDYMEERYEYLCGAGVALELSMRLCGIQEDLIALACIASIGDVMALWKETRKIVLEGMEIMKRRIPRSVASMFRPGSTVNWTSIAFQIVPKLNSVGRMNDLSNVNTLVPFLLSNNPEAINSYTRQLEHVNDVRRQLSDTQTALAESMVKDEKFILIYHEKFHEGICGLIAGRLANTYHKPALVLARHEREIKGSGRSVDGFDMFSFFSDFTELSSFGGHEQAVGVGLKAEDLEAFRAHVNEKMKEVSVVESTHENTAIAVKSDEITMDEIMDLQRAEPLPKEINAYFAITDAQVLTVKETDKVIKYTIANANGPLEAVLYKRKGIMPPEDPHTVIGTLSINRWRSNVTMQIEIEDIY